VRVKFKKTEPVHSLEFNTEADGTSPYCDVLETVQDASEAEVRSFLLRFIAQFYRREEDSVELSESLYDIELKHYSILSDTPLDETKYGRLFIDPRHPDTTGLSDRGLTIFFLNTFLDDAMGVANGDEPVLFVNEIGEAVTVGGYIDAWVHVLTANDVLKGGS